MKGRGLGRIGRTFTTGILPAAAVLLTCTFAYCSDESTFNLRGYLKNYFLAADSNVPDSPPRSSSVDYLYQSKIRVKGMWQPSDTMQGEFAFDIQRLLSERPDFQTSAFGSFSTAANELSYRVKDLRPDIYSNDHNLVYSQNLDRAFLTFSPKFGDISIGRQPVAFGSAMVINPTDILAPFTFDTLDVEDRVGVDAVRLRVPIGALSELDTGVVFGEDFDADKSAMFVRSKLYVANTDVTPIVIAYRENLLVGLDVARSIGGAGFWFDAAHTFAGLLDDRLDDEDFSRVSVGLDYHFDVAGGITPYLEYHYNGASEGKPSLYESETTTVAYRESGVYLLGKNYLAPGFVWNVKPLVTINGALLWNVDDDSAYVTTSLDYNITGNMYIGIGADIAIGDKAEGGCSGAGMEIPSEFGAYPDLYYSYLRIYF